VNAKTDAVHMMTGVTILDKIFHSALGRLFVAALQTVLTSQVLLLTFLFRVQVEVSLLKFTLILGVGLMAGFSARRLLKSHTFMLQLLSSLFSIIISLVVLFSLSAGFLGINLFERTGRTPDWGSLVQLAWASFGAILVLIAFRPRVLSLDPPDTESTAREATLTSHPGTKRWIPQIRLPEGIRFRSRNKGAAPGKEKVSLGKSTARSKRAAKLNTALKTKPDKLALAPTVSPRTKKKNRSKVKAAPAEIKFIGKQEHFCPYCLDPVTDHDSRGVKICPICKTRHHADCWGITGACQIPHSNS
jgi:hypothetical protein